MSKKSRVKGIVVEIGGNTVGLDKALDGTNKKLYTTQGNLKDVERLLKLDPTNTKLLEQRQRLLGEAIAGTEEKLQKLNEANEQAKVSRQHYAEWEAAYEPIKAQIDDTNKKLKDLKKLQKEMEDCGEVDTDAYEQLTEEIQTTSKELRDLKDQKRSVDDQFGNPVSQEAFDGLQREIAETEAQLKQLESAAEGNLQQIGEAVDDTRAKLEKMGTSAGTVKDKATKVADAFQPASTAVVGLATAAAATVPATQELREDLSKLDANAQASGTSAEAARKAWKEFSLQSGETDSAIEAVSNLLQAGFTESNLQQAVEGLAGAAQRFPDTLKVESLADSLQETLATQNATGQFCELLERMGMDTERFNTELAACSTETEKQDLALRALASMGLSESYNAWKATNEEMLANKGASLEVELATAELAETVMPYMTLFMEQIADLLQKFNDLPGPVKTAIAAVLLIVGAISPAASAVARVSGLIETLSKANLPGLGTAFGKITGTVLPSVQTAFTSVFGFIAANPVVLLIAAIVGLVALIATKGDEAQEILQKIDDFLQGIFAKDWTEVFGPVLGGVLNGFFDLVEEIWNGIKLILDGVIDFIRGVFTGDWERAWSGVVKIFQGIFEGLGSLLKAPINGVIKMINEAIGGINWLIEGANKIPGVNIGTIGEIPLLASGGEVFRGSAIVGDAGPELLTVLQDRAVVQPLTNNYHTTSNHLGSVNVAVYGAPGQDVRELAELVAEEMQQIFDVEEAALR